MKRSTKLLLFVVGLAIFGSIYMNANASAAAPTDCSVVDPAVCDNIEVTPGTVVVIRGKAKPPKPVDPPE